MKQLIYYVTVGFMLFAFNTQLAATDYVLNGHAEVQAFVSGATGVKETVGNFKVTGADVTQTDFNSLADRVGTVNGTVTFENLTHAGSRDDGVTVSGAGPFFENVTINGGMVFRNCPFLTWPNGISGKTKVNGDFIVDNCALAFPLIDGWAPTTFFGGFTEVTGDFIITNCTGRFGHETAASLTKVGGNFEISNPKAGGEWSWEMGFKNLQYVGGNFTINGGNLNNLQWWTLDCLASMQYIGGNVSILNCPRMGISGAGNYPYGLCFVRYLVDAEVIDYAHKDVQVGFTGELVDLATLGGCPNGIDADKVPKPLPAKVTGLHDLQKSLNVKIGVTGNTLNVESEVDLSKLEIVNLTGRTMLQFLDLKIGVTPLTISQLSKGIYIVKVTTTDSKIAAYKIIK